MKSKMWRSLTAGTAGLPRTVRAAAWAGIALASALPAGCGGPPRQAERSGAELRRELPDELARLLPGTAVECHRESAGVPGPYTLRIFRCPGGDWLEFPAGLPGLERHDLPASVLGRTLAAKVPGLEVGTPRGEVCRFTHWGLGAAEFQVREIVTDRGWFATVEQFGR